MFLESVAPVSLSVAATVLAALLWVHAPRLKLSVHKERPNAHFSLWEVCLVLPTDRDGDARGLQVSFYLSIKRRK
jgi:hypothetical protein